MAKREMLDVPAGLLLEPARRVIISQTNDLLCSTFPEKIVVVEQQSHIWGGKEGKETAT